MSTVDYGKGSRRRRPSWLAALSLVLPCLALLAGFACLAVYRKMSSSSSGWGALGAFLFGLFLLKYWIITAWITAILSIAAGAASLAFIHLEPTRLFGRKAAVLGVFLSLALLVTAHGSMAAAQRAFAAAGAAGVARTPAFLPPEDPGIDITSLLFGCEEYARKHDGSYPPDAAALFDWDRALQFPVPARRNDYLYCGRGITSALELDHDETTSQRNADLIIWITRHQMPNDKFVVGVRGYRGNGRTLSVTREALSDLLQASNRARAALNLPPIHFEQVSATQPTTEP